MIKEAVLYTNPSLHPLYRRSDGAAVPPESFRSIGLMALCQRRAPIGHFGLARRLRLVVTIPALFIA
jgi:hypothetical protein